MFLTGIKQSSKTNEAPNGMSDTHLRNGWAGSSAKHPRNHTMSGLYKVSLRPVCRFRSTEPNKQWAADGLGTDSKDGEQER